MSKKRILLKLTGAIFIDPETKKLTRTYADHVAQQIKSLREEYYFGIVIGGGSFFRGGRDNSIGLRENIAHTVGMIATTMNGLMLYDILHQHKIDVCSVCGFEFPLGGRTISQQTIDQALQNNQTLVFSGGTGNPFVSTDTNAVIRAQQIGASEIWKASNIDGAYSADPKKTKNAQRFDTISIQEALDKKLNFMDHTALTMAKEASLPLRLFNIFDKDALIQTVKNKKYGTMITPEK